MKNPHYSRRAIISACSLVLFWTSTAIDVDAQVDPKTITRTHPKVVKVYGSGGYANLHSYQTGIFVSPDGKIATAWSHVLDGKIQVLDHLGNRFPARFVNFDPETELAMLQVDSRTNDFFDLSRKTTVSTGQQIVAFSNMFGIAAKNEKLTIMNGVISSKASLDAKGPQFNTPYKGSIYLLDLISNNPGAAGGAVVDTKGNLVGVIGKELKDRQSGTWINFCIPTDVVLRSVTKMQSRKPPTNESPQKAASPFQLADVGLELIPEVVETTRPFVDHVIKGRTAYRAGIRIDDLILFANNQPVRSIKDLHNMLQLVDRDDSITLTVKRNDKLLRFQFSRFKPTGGNK